MATFELLGWPADEVKLPLDHERFAYAGKFVMTSTGKAVAREDCSNASQRASSEGSGDEPRDLEAIIAAVAFSADRTDPETLWLRYVTVARERRGEGLGPRLCVFVLQEATDRYERARIAVNNPFAYEALYRAGFEFTGRETGIAELVLERPIATAADRAPPRYQEGLDRFRERDLSEAEMRFLETRNTLPAIIEA